MGQYENILNKKVETAAAAVSAVSVVSDVQDHQKSELEALRNSFEELKAFVHESIPKIEKLDKKMDDLEQYGRSNCLIVHGCKNAPKSGEYLENEKFACQILNEHLMPSPPLQIEDLDIAHPLPSKKGHAIIIKFLRRTQRNFIYSKKKLLKGTGMVITESLTKRRLQLLEAARTAFGRFSVWTMKGEVFVFYNNKKLHINDFADIDRIKLMLMLVLPGATLLKYDCLASL